MQQSPTSFAFYLNDNSSDSESNSSRKAFYRGDEVDQELNSLQVQDRLQEEDQRHFLQEQWEQVKQREVDELEREHSIIYPQQLSTSTSTSERAHPLAIDNATSVKAQDELTQWHLLSF